ncbi:hypothetical protein KY358_03735 [Candidatus Woesearchaeota archaeon]|nr:hypothetical protein [Candidatus Woesearchaeota archaeon]
MDKSITGELSQGDLREFKKDFIELLRVYFGIKEEYVMLTKGIEKKIKVFKEAVGIFNRKYRGILLKVKDTSEDVALKVIIKEKSVKDVFTSTASKMDGLKAVGARDFGAADIEDPERFSREVDKAKDRIFISYFDQKESHVLLEKHKQGGIELHYGHDILDESSSQFRLCSYYAVSKGVKKMDIYSRLSSIGFLDMPSFQDVRSFLKRFEPRIEE